MEQNTTKPIRLKETDLVDILIGCCKANEPVKITDINGKDITLDICNQIKRKLQDYEELRGILKNVVANKYISTEELAKLGWYITD